MSGPPHSPTSADDQAASPRILRTQSSSSVTPSATWAEHHLSASSSYFPPSSPVVRSTSPGPHRRISVNRYNRSNSAASGRRPPPHRSASLASTSMTSRPQHGGDLLSEAEEDGHRRASDDEEEDVIGHDLQVRAGSRTRDSNALRRGDEEDPSPALDSPNVERSYNEDDPITVKERQSLINVQHPFGLPIWKPALYKKSRTVTRNADNELHAQPSAFIESHYLPGNIFWTIFFGWWLAATFLVLSAAFWLIPYGGRQYAELIYGLSWYVFWPFGKYVQGDEPDEVEKHDDDESDEEEVYEPDDEPVTFGRGRESGSGSSTGTIRGVRSVGAPQGGQALAGADFTRPTSWQSHSSNGERAPLIVETASPSATKSYGALPLSVQGPIEAVEDAKRHRLGTICFWLALITVIAPLMLMVCLICWALVITIPMARLNWELIKHLCKQPNRIRFCAAPGAVVVPAGDDNLGAAENGFAPHQQASDEAGPAPIESSFAVKSVTRLQAGQSAPHGSPRSKVLLCTYRAVGLQYYKYTVGGVNIMFINLLPLVFFAIIDGFFILPYVDRLEHNHQPVPPILAFIASRALIFILSLMSVIPLSYFIGMAVASISAQSSIGMGAVINATFGSVIEVILYSIALTQGKGRLVEGSLVGSILAGVCLMPGVSMCSAAFRQKEQKFNAKSAGVTSTMLIMAIIGVLTPTLFYQTYGNFELICKGCPEGPDPSLGLIDTWKCTHCYYEHPNPVDDPFYQDTVKALSYFSASILVFSYLIGLWFSLRTHASQIWQNPRQLMNPLDLQGSIHGGAGGNTGRTSMYNRAIVSQTSKLLRKASNLTMTGSLTGIPAGSGAGFLPSGPPSPTILRRISYATGSHPHHAQQQPVGPLPPQPAPHSQGASASAAQPESTLAPPKDHSSHHHHHLHLTPDELTQAIAETVSALRHREASAGGGGHGGHGGEGGHDAPSWSRLTSASVLLACTALYAMIAEILVDVVDVVLDGSGIDEKFLGITLFALVPNTTEFMNAISFALNGNIALSMEIGSAYALQVCLLQIPAMVAFSAWYDPANEGTLVDTFTLIFPRWDVIAIILSIFLLTYTYIEAKSNYHRGSILILSYVVLTAGFYFAPPQYADDTFAKWSLDKLDASQLPQIGYLRSLYTQFLSLWSR